MFSAKGAVRLATILSGAVIAGLTLVPAASAATHTANTSPHSINTSNCKTWTDGETWAEVYCPYGPGEFQVALFCQSGNHLIVVNGPWRTAGGPDTSYAQCPTNYFESGIGINIQ